MYSILTKGYPNPSAPLSPHEPHSAYARAYMHNNKIKYINNLTFMFDNKFENDSKNN